MRDTEVQRGMWLRRHPGIQEKREDQLPWWLSGKEPACQCRRHGFNPWSRKIPQATATKPARECSVVSNSSRPHGLQPARFLCPWDSPGKNPGVGGHVLLQGNLPHPGTIPVSPVSPALAGGFTAAPPGTPAKLMSHDC